MSKTSRIISKTLNQVSKLTTGLLILVTVFLVGCQSSKDAQTEASQSTDNSVDTELNSTQTSPDVVKEVINPCPECGQKREFRGNFVYFADAAILRECGSQTPLTVAVNPKMQLAYELHRKGPEAPLYFVAQGEIMLQPSMEEGVEQKQLLVDGDNWYFDAYGSCE